MIAALIALFSCVFCSSLSFSWLFLPFSFSFCEGLFWKWRIKLLWCEHFRHDLKKTNIDYIWNKNTHFLLLFFSSFSLCFSVSNPFHPPLWISSLLTLAFTHNFLLCVGFSLSSRHPLSSAPFISLFLLLLLLPLGSLNRGCWQHSRDSPCHAFISFVLLNFISSVFPKTPSNN